MPDPRLENAPPALPTMPSAGRLISEAQWQGQVRQLALMFGFRVYHSWTSLHSTAGFPDLVLLKESQLLFAELKSDNPRASITEEQTDWLTALTGIACARVFLWRPSDLDEVAQILSWQPEPQEGWRSLWVNVRERLG